MLPSFAHKQAGLPSRFVVLDNVLPPFAHKQVPQCLIAMAMPSRIVQLVQRDGAFRVYLELTRFQFGVDTMDLDTEHPQM